MPVKGDKQLQAKVAKLKAALMKTAPQRIAIDAQRHFMQSFRDQGFTDRGLVKWRPLRKPRTNAKGKVLQGRILKGKGLLANSIRVIKADWNGIVVAAGGPHVPYARLHNEGGWIRRQVTRRAHVRGAHIRRTKRYGAQQVSEANVRRHQARMNLYMIKRQFMGDSHVLRRKMRETILKTITESLVK